MAGKARRSAEATRRAVGKSPGASTTTVPDVQTKQPTDPSYTGWSTPLVSRRPRTLAVPAVSTNGTPGPGCRRSAPFLRLLQGIVDWWRCGSNAISRSAPDSVAECLRADHRDWVNYLASPSPITARAILRRPCCSLLDLRSQGGSRQHNFLRRAPARQPLVNMVMPSRWPFIPASTPHGNEGGRATQCWVTRSDDSVEHRHRPRRHRRGGDLDQARDAAWAERGSNGWPRAASP